MRAFRIAYDGRPYYGFQRQPTVPTVEGALFDALRELSVLSDESDKPTGYAAAGRTDAGVSAVAQTVAFDCPEWLTPRALNSELPATIRAWASTDVDEEFHATHDARRRAYVYHAYAPAEAPNSDATTNRPLAGTPTVEDRAATTAAETLSGHHEFQNLTPDETGTERELSISLNRSGDILAVTVVADGFPRQLVRRLVSVIQAVGSGRRSIEWVNRLLEPEPIEPRPPAAPPEPLVLDTVEYPVTFERDQQAAESGMGAFGEQAVEAIVGQQVTTAIADRLAASTNTDS